MTPHCAEGFFYHHWHRCLEGIYCCVRCWIIAPDLETEHVLKWEDVPSGSASLSPVRLAGPQPQSDHQGSLGCAETSGFASTLGGWEAPPVFPLNRLR